jgi:leucine-zipper of insertion element IS481
MTVLVNNVLGLSWFILAKLAVFGRQLLLQRIIKLGWPVATAAQSLGVSRSLPIRRWRQPSSCRHRQPVHRSRFSWTPSRQG